MENESRYVDIEMGNVMKIITLIISVMMKSARIEFKLLI